MLDKIKAINDEASQIASSIRVLGAVSWPINAADEFLSKPPDQRVPPEVQRIPAQYHNQIQQLTSLRKKVGGTNALEIFTAQTIDSLIAAAIMVDSSGTPAYQEISESIYGRPDEKIAGLNRTNIQIAQDTINMVDGFSHPHMQEPELCVAPKHVKQYLEENIARVFRKSGPSVQIVDGLAAKATATARMVKLRNETCFSLYDYDQLLHHEVFIHSLTALNGMMQPVLSLMGKGTPRTVSTQEGLATFAEVITGSIDLNRLRRLALRIIGIDKALAGADFMEIYRFFLANDQSERESFFSTARIFRGGDHTKGVVFTKDCVYLEGLVRVHTLFRWAIRNAKLGILHTLFTGRIAIEDIFLLEEAYNVGQIKPPMYVPPWYERIEGLAGILSFSLLTNAIEVHDFQEFFGVKKSEADKLPREP